MSSAGLSRLAPAGFMVEGHEITLYGLCPECSRVPVATPSRRRSTATGSSRR